VSSSELDFRVKTDGQILPKSVFLMFHSLAIADSFCAFFISFDVVKSIGWVNSILNGGFPCRHESNIRRPAEARVKVELDWNVVGEIVIHIWLAWVAENR
jgi:hypothetical protein